MRGLVTAATIFAFAASSLEPIAYYLRHLDALWVDAHVYFRATQAWVSGQNPWTASPLSVPFAAPPPALLLNLPFLPFGESAAVAAWAAMNTVALVLLFRRFRLPLWWLVFQPVSEGWLVASADLTLAALVLIGGGAVATAVKPYSIPALLAEWRWRAILIGLGSVLITLPILPWREFYEARVVVGDALRRWSHPSSALVDPLLLGIVVVSLVSLGLRRGMSLVTPGLLALQPHYLIFSLGPIRRSAILAMTMTFSTPHAAALGLAAYAVQQRLRHVRRRRRIAIRATAKDPAEAGRS